MDQTAFRALIKTKDNGPSKTKFGSAPPKRSAVPTAAASTSVTSASTSQSSSTDFKPRQQPKDKSKYIKKKGSTEEGDATTKDDASGYRDRAAERRLGKKSDFSAAEQLLEDFKARIGDSPTADLQDVEDKMKYLGGDAEHTVLVKGLDMALLERTKAQQSAGADHLLSDVEDELDQVLSGRKNKQKKKRTRDELIAELKAGKTGSAGGEGGIEEAKLDSRFKKVGFKPVGRAGEDEGSATQEKKKKRKKKARPPPEGEPTAPTLEKKEERAPMKTKEAPALRRNKEDEAKPLPIPETTIDVDGDDDFDIFGNAGDYKGLDTDSEDEEDGDQPGTSKVGPPIEKSKPSTLPTKRKYFDDDDDDEGPISTAPESVTNLATVVPPKSKRRNSSGETLEEGEEDDGDEERPMMRLQPLSKSAIPSVKELLALDAAAEKEEKRKERKQHFKMEAADEKEAMLKKMTPEQRAEHEHQVMMSYLEKKQRKADGGGGETGGIEDDDIANGGF